MNIILKLQISISLVTNIMNHHMYELRISPHWKAMPRLTFSSPEWSVWHGYIAWAHNNLFCGPGFRSDILVKYPKTSILLTHPAPPPPFLIFVMTVTNTRCSAVNMWVHTVRAKNFLPSWRQPAGAAECRSQYLSADGGCQRSAHPSVWHAIYANQREIKAPPVDIGR